MSTSNSVANGARLDDCHSTIFALADLSGIKWQKFSSDAAGLSGDSVLSAFTTCLSLDILAVWRTAPRKSSESSQSARDSFSKELWVFWWGVEPHIDEIAHHQGLKDEEKGCWEDGLSYECRTLLFKAIHNLVERCLLHENFVRIGQWFFKPLLSKEADEDVSDRFSFSFSFFLHGESSVCTAVEVARHKSLERLTYSSFQQITANSVTNSVILVPFGLKAKLSGISYRPHDPVSKKLLEEWKSFYPIVTSEDNVLDEAASEEDHIDHVPIPPVVEVAIGGNYMNYPSHFVLLPTAERTDANSDANSKSENALYEVEKCSNATKPLNYDQPSVQSVSEMISDLIDLSKASKNAGSKQQFKEFISRKSRYFANRIRVRSKAVCATVVNSSDVATALPESHIGKDINSGLTNDASGNPVISWHFEDSFKGTRFANNLLSRDSWKTPPERANRPSNYGSFHHRSFNKNDKKIHQNTLKLPPQYGAATPKDTIFQDPTSESFLSPADPALQAPSFQVPSDKIFNSQTISEDQMNKYNSKPFVSLGNMSAPPTWMEEEPVKNNSMEYPAYVNSEPDQTLEFPKLVDAWESYKLPMETHSFPNKKKRLHSDNLDSAASYAIGSRISFRRSHSKRLKDSSTACIETSFKSEAALSLAPHPCTVQQVSVGAVNGELAGMALSSDPYAFDDVEDTINQPSSSSDISLKPISLPASQQVAWQSLQQPFSGEVDYKSIANNPSAGHHTGKSELEFLLQQNNSPAASTAMPVTSLSYTTTISSGPSKSLNEFSMDDLEDAMEEEDSGVPTPPADPGDNRINDHVAAILPVNPVSSNPVTDLQRMFPTPPSLESCQPFSPEAGRALHSVASSQIALSASSELDPNSLCKRDSDKLEISSGFPLSDHPQYSVTTSLHNAPTVLHANSKTLAHPTSELYQPLSNLSQLLPLSHSYVPSWMVPSNLPPDDCIVALPGYAMNPPTPSMTVGGNTPCTPGHSSVRTPASVQPSSVPTPGRIGLCSIESAHSYQTPSSHGPVKGRCRDHHGSAALHMNLLLSDSVMNMFRDKSFDQCALCACNTNIKGTDVELGYLPAVASTEAQYPCTCGFSAVRNRLASVGTGLFLEDELDIVGLEHESEIIETRKHAGLPRPIDNDNLFSLIIGHCSSPFCFSRLIQKSYDDDLENGGNVVTKRDEREALAQALSIGLSTMEQPMTIDASSLTDAIHPWKQDHSDVLTLGSSLDLYRLLASLKPVLQDAIQRKKTTRSFGCTQHVKGPLTWREFCKEAGKNAEPQPIPSFVVGYDHDWLVVSPHALKYWEKLFLEPYSKQRDIVYLVVCPDDDQVIGAARLFFRELSSIFESCRLGHLKPYNKKVTDAGIVRIGQQTSHDDQRPNTDRLSWLSVNNSKNGSGDNANLISLYARAFIGKLGPLLKSEQNLNFNSMHVRPVSGPPSVSSHPTPGDRMASLAAVSGSRPSPTSTQSPSKSGGDQSVHVAPFNADTASVIALFVLDPFRGGMSRDLWHCYHSLLGSLSSPVKDHLLLQIVPVDTVLQATSSCSADSYVQILRSLAFSTFAQCHSHTPSGGAVRSMTGFGPRLSNRLPSFISQTFERSVYAPLYILADPHEKRSEALAASSRNNVLYVCYCLSRDQKWLLATATDQRGELLEHCCINIDAPPRRLARSRKHRRISVRSGAIEKLWKFCETTCLQFSCSSWRVVVGKLGRLSHAEIQDWAKHLSKRTLQSTGRHKNCQQCKLQQKGENSALILSACLTSLEPDASLRILPDVVQANNFGRGSSNSNQSAQLKTPDDVSCTHIYVYPTSAVTQLPGANQAGAEEDPYLNQADPGILPADLLEDIFMDLPGGIMDPTSPAQNPHHFSVGDDDVMTKTHNATDRLLSSDVGAVEELSLLQQPLSLGYLVSTAPPGPLPSWFWATCPQARNRCPVFMRSALHIQTSINEAAGDSTLHPQHPLDSSKTSVVLRFVLESYNALSWLTRDPVTRDRRSCLPVHCLSLVQLYHTVENLFYGSVQ